MTQSTTQYDTFIFREDNRAKIDRQHVNRLKESITQSNLLDTQPILVTPSMEVIDGQHRLIAAKELKVPIYYIIEDRLKPSDIVLLNISKHWSSEDFLNYYVKNHMPEYVKLNDFIKKTGVSTKVALSLNIGAIHHNHKEYRLGNYTFEPCITLEQVEWIWETIHYIQKINGYSAYTRSAKFWKVLARVFRNEVFQYSKWILNLHRQVDKFGPRSTEKGYEKTCLDVYNWRNNQRIESLEE